MNLPEIRQQPYLKCCYHCKYNCINWDGDGYCGISRFDNDELRDNCPTSVCDAFELECE